VCASPTGSNSCTQQCITCSGVNTSFCYECASGSTLNVITRTCQSQCPAGYYESLLFPSQCVPCAPQCLTCAKNSSQFCTQCRGLPLFSAQVLGTFNGQCFDNCSSPIAYYQADKNACVSRRQCYSEGYYPSNSTGLNVVYESCLPCSSNCSRCAYNATNCT
jgi:hypothetical protein